MIYLIVFICILLLALTISIKINIKQSEDKKQLKDKINKLEAINEKMSKINTGDVKSDFNESIELLHNYANNK